MEEQFIVFWSYVTCLKFSHKPSIIFIISLSIPPSITRLPLLIRRRAHHELVVVVVPALVAQLADFYGGADYALKLGFVYQGALAT